MTDFLHDAAERGIRYIETITQRRVSPAPEALAALTQFDEPFPEGATDPAEIVRLLDEFGAPATVASTGGRYYGFVTGGSLPAATAANILIAAWDQNAALRVMSPIAVKLEDVAIGWLLDALGFPQDFGASLVTGATMANFVGVAAARNYLLDRAGWSVEKQGLFGAPEIRVIVGEEIHVSMLQALSMVGFGTERLIRVPADEQGRMIADQLPELDAMTLVVTQAGNVNTGAFDPIGDICDKAHEAGAWVHVDGAFGLWALASSELRHLVDGVEKADSWATDGHKWLNVSYDNGIAFCRYPQAIRSALSVNAPYLVKDENREPLNYSPENSRRARGIEIWAALKSLGRAGLAEMIERNCRQARRFGTGLQEAGFTVHHDVVLNQVLVSFGDSGKTERVIAAVQADGTAWAGPSRWQGHTAMRISVSSWATTNEDVEAALAAIIRIAREM